MPIHGTVDDQIQLEIREPLRRIADWGTFTTFREPDDTRKLINKILHYEALGADTAYFEVVAEIQDVEKLKDLIPKSRNEINRGPILCDLIAAFGLESDSQEQINRHSVQLINTFNRPFQFIHLTDLHVARRNDELLDHILHVRKGSRPDRPADAIEESFINFNDNLRRFIRVANGMAEKGELDFVVISGDLVDFAFHGWEHEANFAENNWQTFLQIITGSGNESLREFDCPDGGRATGNPGLKVAVFTSTGNHDWRLFPYDPGEFGQWKKFGLKGDEIDQFDFKSYDELRHDKKREELAPEIAKRHFQRWNLGGIKGDYGLKIAKWIASESSKKGLAAITGFAGFAGAETILAKQGPLSSLLRWGLPLFAGAAAAFIAQVGLNMFMKRKIRFLMDNPLRAESMALHYYLVNISPYLDYVFSFGKHMFVVMDTGMDVITGDLFDGKGLGDLKRLSFKDNVLGGSPDSRAFDSQRVFYNWSQIVWLEKVLQIPNEENTAGSGRDSKQREPKTARTFIFLHAPPLNTDRADAKVASELWEKKGTRDERIRKRDYKLTYGTINHFVSELLFLCLGYFERDIYAKNYIERCQNVDIVFSGHAHRNLEFRLESAFDDPEKIAIYSKNYSEILEPDQKWWDQKRPFLVQTPACGIPSKCEKAPPYFRLVKVDDSGMIESFKVMNLSDE